MGREKLTKKVISKPIKKPVKDESSEEEPDPVINQDPDTSTEESEDEAPKPKKGVIPKRKITVSKANGSPIIRNTIDGTTSKVKANNTLDGITDKIDTFHKETKASIATLMSEIAEIKKLVMDISQTMSTNEKSLDVIPSKVQEMEKSIVTLLDLVTQKTLNE